MVIPAMELHDAHSAVSDVDTAAVVLRVLLLSSTAVVAGIGLMRPAVTLSSRRTATVAWLAGWLAGASSVMSIFVLDVNIAFALAHTALVLGLTILLRLPNISFYIGFASTVVLIAETSLGHSPFEFLVDTVYTAAAVIWLGLAVLSVTVSPENRPGSGLRPGPVGLTVALALASASIAQLALSGLVDRRLYTSGYGLALLVIVAASVAVVGFAVVLSRRDAWRVYRIGAIGVGVAFLAWSSLPAIPRPPELPTPGVPRLVDASVAGQALPVLVSPHRPGRNLVHFPDSAGRGIIVEAGGRLVPATARPGSEGTWAEVDLPAGRGDVVIHRDDDQQSVDVDTGTSAGPASAIGRDGAECASAALGGLLAGARDVLAGCPSDELTPDDADALRKLVGFIAANSAPGITVLGDESPRAREAADVVRSAAADKKLRVSPSPQADDALVVVSGWSVAAGQLESVTDRQRIEPTYVSGVHLAPWLLHEPIVTAAATSSVPLRFDPRDQRSLEYGMTLASGFGGELPSVAGFNAWVAARRQAITDPVAVYASAQVDVMKMDLTGTHDMPMHGSVAAGQWIPHSTIVAISGPLSL
jgi:hypothetical protein